MEALCAIHKFTGNTIYFLLDSNNLLISWGPSDFKPHEIPKENREREIRYKNGLVICLKRGETLPVLIRIRHNQVVVNEIELGVGVYHSTPHTSHRNTWVFTWRSKQGKPA